MQPPALSPQLQARCGSASESEAVKVHVLVRIVQYTCMERRSKQHSHKGRESRESNCEDPARGGRKHERHERHALELLRRHLRQDLPHQSIQRFNPSPGVRSVYSVSALPAGRSPRLWGSPWPFASPAAWTARSEHQSSRRCGSIRLGLCIREADLERWEEVAKKIVRGKRRGWMDCTRKTVQRRVRWAACIQASA